MKETIEIIVKSIKKHRGLEMDKSLNNPAIGRCHVFYQNENKILWLTNKENIIGKNSCDIIGNVIQRNIGKPTTLMTDGQSIYKNTKVGEILILNHEGTHTVNTPKGEFSIKLFNRASFVPVNKKDEYAKDVLIKIAGDSKTHSFQNLFKVFSLQLEIEQEQEKLKDLTKHEAEQLIQRIDNKKAEIKKYLEKAQSFIRKHAELRYQPILDPIQESIKRSKIFDGPLIINGGPGTGKTTSLIQRIKFLISPSIEDYIFLNQNQKEVLFDQKTSWIFFSPNELLALYLRNNMKMEDLSADSERVKVWSSHKNELVKAYKLVDTTAKGPFLIYNKSQGKSLFVNKPKKIHNIISGLNKFYLDFQKEKFNKILEIDVLSFKWKDIGLSIQKYINNKKNIKNIEELIRLFLNLNKTYKTESDIITEEYFSLIKKVAGRIQVMITKDVKRVTEISEILNNWKNSNQDMDDEGDIEIELEDFDEKEEKAFFEFDIVLFNKLKSLCRKQALKKYDKKTKFNKVDLELIKIIPEVKEQIEYDDIGQIAFYKKYFERITKGITANVLREIPMIYKKYRRSQLTNKNINWNVLILNELIKKDNNKRIHSDEQALLLYFINEICLNLSKVSLELFNSLNHTYLFSYKNNCKPVIGIDEATDFSIIDLLAIYSLRHPLLSSLTLSGDIMQRMTDNGLSNWEDFSCFISNTETKNLNISYRQSPTLLAMAQYIYEKSTGKKANYKSFLEKDETEPKPLMFVSTNEDEKLNWIAERIIEIYKAYGSKNIPSIAIFLPNENLLESFSSKLGNLDTLSDVGILVKPSRRGEVLGDKNTVRVISIDKIKGLEFEAVFFYDFDKLQNENISNELLLKYLYVGLSRATFYLGIIVSEDLNRGLSFLTKFFKKNKTWHNLNQ